MILEWDAWDPSAGDIGDGPVIAYYVYNTESFVTILAAVIVSPTQPQTVYIAVVGSLTPGTEYSFYVRVVREGVGGEGPPSTQFVTFTTLSSQPQPITQPPALTTTMVIPTTKTTTTSQMQTSQKLTTMQKPDRTSPASGMRTSPRRNTAMRDRTTLGMCYKCLTCRSPNPRIV